MNGLDEFGLIAHLSKRVTQAGVGIQRGIGDDAAVLVLGPDEELVVTMDTMVEGVHFLSAHSGWGDIGHKLVTVSVSDVAAMGGTPRHLLLSLAIPRAQPLATLEALYDGVAKACSEYRCALVGGDVVSTPGPPVLTSTVLGAVPSGQSIFRSGARPGDTVFVTGPVGSSGAGLRYLVDKPVVSPEDAVWLAAAHRRPHAQVEAGGILRESGVSSLNDISDGLASELHEIATASGIRMRIDANRVPVAPAVRNLARHRGEDPLQYAWFGGEDYQLVGTAPSLAFARALARCQSVGISLTAIGRVEPGEGVLVESGSGLEVLEPKGFNHFA